VFLEKLLVAQLVVKIPTLYVTQRVIAVFTDDPDSELDEPIFP
jgi:hypothetical protein